MHFINVITNYITITNMVFWSIWAVAYISGIQIAINVFLIKEEEFNALSIILLVLFGGPVTLIILFGVFITRIVSCITRKIKK